MIIKVVDIGSNSIKASLYSVESQSHKQLEKHKLSFSLGEQVFSGGSISEDATSKVAAFIQGLPGALGGEKVHFTFVVATSAVRSAGNRGAFVRKIEQKLECPVRILSGQEESYLIHMGMISKAVVGAEETVTTVDIGGGSAEISWSSGYNYLFGNSYELGAIRLTKKFCHNKAFTREAWERIRSFTLGEFRTATEQKAPPQSHRALGSSGNLRAIAKMTHCVRAMPFIKLLPEITRGSLEDILEISLGKQPAQIHQLFDIGLERARIILPAVAVLHTSMQHFGIPRIAISEAGLREGIIYFWGKHGHLSLPVSPEIPFGGAELASRRAG